MSNISNDERTQCKDLRSRGKYLWKSGKLTDCELLVGANGNKTTIKAHRVILTMASPVLEEYFQLQDPQPLDVDVNVFKNILIYIYTDEFLINSVEMALEMGQAAFKFRLEYLVNASAVYLKGQMKPENVCKIFELGKLINDAELIDKSLKFIQRNIKEIIEHSSFIEISLDTLETICMQETLNISNEMELYNAIYKYYLSKSSNKVAVEKINEIVKHIRFLTLTPIELIQGLQECNLSTPLSPSNALKIVSKMLKNEEDMPNGFSLDLVNRNRVHPEVDTGKDLINEQLDHLKFNTNIYNDLINKNSNGINQLEIENMKFTIIKQLVEYENTTKEISIQKQEHETEFKEKHPIIELGQKIRVMEFESKDMLIQLQKYISIHTMTSSSMREWQSKLNEGTKVCSVTFKLNAHRKLIAVQLPTQKLNNTPTLDKLDYKERLQVCVYADSKKQEANNGTQERCIINNYEADVPYNSICTVDLKPPIKLIKNQVYRISVVFLNPGHYPLAVTVDNVEISLGEKKLKWQLGGEDNSNPGLVRGILLELDNLDISN